MEKRPKMVVVGDALLTPDFIAGSFSPFAEAGWEIVSCRFGPDDLQGLDESLLVLERHGPDAVAAPPGLERLLPDADVLVVHICPVSGDLLRRFPNLLAVGVLRGGYENVDAAAAKELGIPVFHTRGRTSEAVSDFAIGLMLAEIRNIARCHAEIRSGSWPKVFPNTGRIPEMRELTVGLVGFGEIGRLVTRKLGGFGCRVQVYDPYISAEQMATDGVNAVGLDELLASSDIVSLHARHAAGSPPVLGKSELALMKPGAYLVNTARASLVDMKALAGRLHEGRLSGAAIDVFDEEPLPPGHPLAGLANVTLTSHIAFDTEAFYKRSPFLWWSGVDQALAGSDTRAWVNPGGDSETRLVRLRRNWIADSSD